MARKGLNRIPVATYRVQFNKDFTLRQANEIIEYLNDLGITDLYASPLFAAGPDSTHGYDICDYSKINPNIGTVADLNALSSTLFSKRMGLLLDMVPNHMGAYLCNAWWFDVLKFGKNSEFASFFDINWDDPNSPGKVLLPVLGCTYGEALERDQLKLISEGSSSFVQYYDQKFPIDPATQPGTVNLSREELDSLLKAQNYRLAWWRVASDEINYRRFFDVTSLVSLRMEDEAVFTKTHDLVFNLVNSGTVTGLRIDHPDGLRDPKEYLQRLQDKFTSKDSCLYVVVEKILSGEEKLPADWPVSGTTGYDFLNSLNGVFIQHENEGRFTSAYTAFLKSDSDYNTTARISKKEILQNSLSSEVHQLSRRLKALACQLSLGADLTFASLRQAITEVLTCFPVYRNYFSFTVSSAGLCEHPLNEDERKYITKACAAAAKSLPEKCLPSLDFIQKILLREKIHGQSPEFSLEAAEFIMRFQQLSGPATAKGLEDTAFYRYNRFVSLNEVGGEPGKFGVSVEAFHEFNQFTCNHWPHTQIATATHDTKRGEDVRARLNILSEIPDEWTAVALSWQKMNDSFVIHIDGQRAPSCNDEYLIYQTLVGSWIGPALTSDYTSRIKDYMRKAMREAKRFTSWTEVNEGYEKAVFTFVERILSSEGFLEAFTPFQSRVSDFGYVNSLSQLVLKICSPGVPDFYQGSELWDFNLVDPDNRRPVNFERSREMLQNLKTTSAKEPISDFLRTVRDCPSSGAIKFFVTWTALNLRRRYSDLFTFGEYHPLYAEGPAANHLISFIRSHQQKAVIVAVPRWLTSLGSNSNDALQHASLTQTWLNLPFGRWRNVFTGEQFDSSTAMNLAMAFKEFPVLLLEPGK